MNVINIGGLIRKVPSSWNELERKDMMWLMENFEHLLKPSYEFRLRFMLRLLNIQKWRLRKLRDLFNVPVAQISYLSNIVDWAMPIENVRLSKNLVPTKYVLGTKLLGPADGLANLTLEEFSFADFHFRAFMTTQNVAELNKLCAILWRKKGEVLKVDDVRYRNDNRILFNSYAINKNAYRFKFAPLKFKYFILMFFWGNRNIFVDKHPNVFSGGNESQSAGLNLGWINVMFELAGSKFGTLVETSKQDIGTILIYLENSILTQKKKTT